MRTARLPRLALRLTAFAALAAFCLGHYALLAETRDGGRVLALVAVATAGGAALAATARLPRVVGTAARVMTVAVMSVAALAVTGLELRLIAPGNWDELRDGLDHGFAGLYDFAWPYSGDDHWVRLTLLLGMPVLAVPAAVLAFWPARRRPAALRTAAIVPLLVAYGTGVTNLYADNWGMRGAALLLLVAAFAWLPRLRRREAVAAAGAVLAAALVAMPVAAGLDARDPWVDYRNWRWFSQQGDGTAFAWDHSYGPITWPRRGTRLLSVSSEDPHYWKAQTLSRFDGLRWVHVDEPPTGDPVGDIPQPDRREWNERIGVTVRGLETSQLVVAGVAYRIDSDRLVVEQPDGTARLLNTEFSEGDSYTAYGYAADPTADEMRAAPPGYPDRVAALTWFDLPESDQSGLEPPRLGDDDRDDAPGDRTITPDVPNAPLSGEDLARVEASPYGRVYRLARRLAAGQQTTYDVVRSIERYVQTEHEYSESPPARRHPLVSFLFEDRVGYCQQFSGAMALMLRMNGIPARVAAGFSPGTLNRSTGDYEVRDLDAHSWVEVWFTGIGWVPFDPTPSLAPAGSQSSSADSPSAARGARGGEEESPDAGDEAAAPAPAAGGGGGDGGLGPLLAVLGATGAAALAVLWLTGVLPGRARAAASAEGAVHELRLALERLGHEYPPRTTLTDLERRLRVTAGEPAARYVARLRSLRYARPGGERPPDPRERRDLRRALTEGSGPIGRLRGLIALPPRRRAY